MVVELDPAGKGDLGSGRQHHLGVGAALGSDKITAVDHRGGERAMADQRSGARTPGRGGVNFEALGGLVAEQLHAVAALDQRDAFGGDPFQFDRSHFGAVLLALALALRLFVVVELALDAVDGAVEQVDR